MYPKYVVLINLLSVSRSSIGDLGLDVFGTVLDTITDVYSGEEVPSNHCGEHRSCSSCTSTTELNCTWFHNNETCAYSSKFSTTSCNRSRTSYSEEISLLMLSYSYYAYGCHVTLPNTTTNITWQRDKLSKEYDKMNRKFDISGYTALDTSNQRIIVSFTGSTSMIMAAWEAFDSKLQPFDLINSSQIEQYNLSPNMAIIDSMYKVYKQLYPNISANFEQLMDACPNCAIWFTGHSLGGNLAAIAAMHFSIKYDLNVGNILIYTYGGCRAFNFDFAQSIDKMFHGRLYRIVDSKDVIPHILACHSSKKKTCVQDSKYRYHHGIEIYYTNEFCNYTECLNEPFGEDPHCSNSKAFYDLRFWTSNNAHHRYRNNLLNGGFCIDQDADNSTVTPLMEDDTSWEGNSCLFGIESLFAESAESPFIKSVQQFGSLISSVFRGSKNKQNMVKSVI